MSHGRTFSSTDLLKSYRLMLTSRMLDEKMLILLRQSKSFFHIGAAGHEAAQIGAGLVLRPGVDWAFPYYRDLAFMLSWGTTPKEILLNFLAKAEDPSSAGRQMPQHYGHKRLRIVSQSSPTGTQFLQAVGVAMGCKKSGTDELVYVSSGEGTTSQGDFYEAINWATRDKLPVLFFIEDNAFAISVPSSVQAAGTSVYEMALGYKSMHRHLVDGLDLLKVAETVAHCAELARRGKGPSLIVARTIRLFSHSSSDDQRKYRDQRELAASAAADPILRLAKLLIERSIASEEQLDALLAEVRDAVEEAAAAAEAAADPDPAHVLEHLYASSRIETVIAPEPAGVGAPVVMVDALNHALAEALEANPAMLIYGQDVADPKGGVFTVTKGLSSRFGPDRVFNSPLAESSIIGTAIGLAVRGFKPVVEIQFGDYIWTAMMQLRNEVATLRWRSAGQFACSVVIRVPVGGYIHGGLCHSQNIEGFFAHLPGLCICYPSNAADAKGLLKEAIRCEDPVLFLEHKGLYRQSYAIAPEPDSDYCLPFGVAKKLREGRHATIVTWGMLVHKALKAAERLAREGIELEILDLRTILPLDLEAIIASLARTGRLLVLHEDTLTAGFGAEIAARVADAAFEHLDAPVRRLAALDSPIPYASGLEEAVLPQLEGIIHSVRALVAY
ncbi:MAG TPA: dehydrogenase E1 component subunit alpha/beta [bacterium]|nr:dehydrogenase E1 component subunit alpha/beta [bacterium]HQJ64793.1 dehydrogenase E1 component subunit alpha/beta [bacterium]